MSDDANGIVESLRELVNDRNALEAIANPADSYCAECGAVQSHSLESLWVQRYAEMLGCDARPAAVACAIDSLINELERCRKSIGRHRAAAFKNGLEFQREKT